MYLMYDARNANYGQRYGVGIVETLLQFSEPRRFKVLLRPKINFTFSLYFEIM